MIGLWRKEDGEKEGEDKRGGYGGRRTGRRMKEKRKDEE